MTNTGATIIIIARAQYNVNKKYNNIAFVMARARLRADSDNYRRVKLQYASKYRVLARERKKNFKTHSYRPTSWCVHTCVTLFIIRSDKRASAYGVIHTRFLVPRTRSGSYDYYYYYYYQTFRFYCNGVSSIEPQRERFTSFDSYTIMPSTR